jgi:4-amino-4-deoxy-L-arabinose transferase-like glycosyltransferase
MTAAAFGPPPGRVARRPVLERPVGRRWALGGLLGGAGVLWTVGLSASGWANAYYSAASQAGAMSWRAMLFGGLDPGGGITVDKPPAALWLADLSVRVFGLSSLSVLLPQAACGVAAVALLHLVVRRQALALGPAVTGAAREARATAVGLFAAGALALTPVVTLMARYNNPDALMVTLTLGAAYALMRSIAVPRGGGGWSALAGALLGLAFLTKLLQAWLVLPAFLAVLLVAGAGSLGHRLARAVGAAAAIAGAAGWWVLLVQLTPAADRPWIGGSRSNSVLELALGYDGLGRVTGQEGAGGAADVARPGSGLRLFGSWAAEASWLLPAALVCLTAGWVLTRGRDRRDPTRAGLLLWGVWLLGAGAVLSSLRGISHGYYAVQLAPAIAGAVALGGALLVQRAWTTTGGAVARRVLAGTVLVTGLWSAWLLLRRPAWPMGMVPVVVLAAVVAVVGLLAAQLPGTRRLVAVAAMVALLAGPATWSVATAASVHRGPNVRSGPGVTQVHTPAGFTAGSSSGVRLPALLADTVRSGAKGYRWAAAVVGRRAADLQLASGASVWSLGGYDGGDPHPTVPEFAAAVAAGRVHYLVLDGTRGPLAAELHRWAALRARPVRSGTWSLFDLGSATTASAPDPHRAPPSASTQQAPGVQPSGKGG